MRAVGLLVAMASLLVVPGMADASTSASCKVIGQTKRVVAKKKTDYLICSLSGKRKVWKATTPAIGTNATVLSKRGLPFIDMALTVKNYAAQCVLVMSGSEVVENGISVPMRRRQRYLLLLLVSHLQVRSLESRKSKVS